MNSLAERWTRAVKGLEGVSAWLPATAARFVVGWVFFWSGWGKLHNLEGVTQFFASLGIPAPEIQAPFVAATEFGCGLLLLLGLATRVASIPLIGVMAVAILTALSDRVSGLTDLLGLSEFCYIVLLATLVILGAGPLSLDRVLATRFFVPRETARREPAPQPVAEI